MARNLKWWTRKLHRLGAAFIAIPLLIVIVSGLLLQVKKEFEWIQPATCQGSSTRPEIEWATILDRCQQVAEAEAVGWEDVDRIDFRIGKGVLKVQCKNGWELQLDSATGELLAWQYRRSDLIEDIHDGSFFTELAKMWIFLPSGIILLILWLTGIYLWYLPWGAKRRQKISKLEKLKKRVSD